MAQKVKTTANSVSENVVKDVEKNVESNGSNNASQETKFVKKSKRNPIPPITANYPEHIVAIALIVKNNAEIKRFTALGILNYLMQKGEISGKSRYVNFKWNKFAVNCDGLIREFSYNETFFINALVAAFTSFSASAQRTIDAFCKKEMSVGINKAVDQEEVDNIIGLNEDYQNNSAEPVTDENAE